MKRPGCRWDEIDRDTWTIPAARYKTKTDHAVPLTGVARDLDRRAAEGLCQRPFVFSTTDGKEPFSGYSKAKTTLDKKIAELRTEGRARRRSSRGRCTTCGARHDP